MNELKLEVKKLEARETKQEQCMVCCEPENCDALLSWCVTCPMC